MNREMKKATVEVKLVPKEVQNITSPLSYLKRNQ
jgi:hypothetical protein